MTIRYLVTFEFKSLPSTCQSKSNSHSPIVRHQQNRSKKENFRLGEHCWIFFEFNFVYFHKCTENRDKREERISRYFKSDITTSDMHGFLVGKTGQI